MKSFVFELPEPLEYSTGGNVTDGTQITFYAPKPNQRKKTAQLKQAFFRALPKEGGGSNQDQKGDEFSIEGNEVLFVVAQSDSDYGQFIETGRSLICDKLGKVDDVEFFTTVMADKLDLDTLESMIGEYVANFILRSALQSLMKS